MKNEYKILEERMETRDRLKYLSVNVKVIINKMGYVRVD
jgi:hypothetical protein